MNANDTSDEAMRERAGKRGGYQFRRAWLECRRRCEAQMEERERKAFEAGAKAWAAGDGVPPDQISSKWLDEAYRVWKGQNDKGDIRGDSVSSKC